MPASSFDTWAIQSKIFITEPVKDFGHSTEGPFIGVDAAHFLEEFYVPEPLVGAVGGYPSDLEDEILKAIDLIESAGCKLHFVFNGLQTNFDEPGFEESTTASAEIARAFYFYEQKDAQHAKEVLQSCGFPDRDWLCHAFKFILTKHARPFVVAPFKAHAQMVYALQQGALDALYGPSELFLYGASKIIVSIRTQDNSSNAEDGQPNGHTNSENGQEAVEIHYLDLEKCLKALGDISVEMFHNAMLLGGTKYIKPFPPLRDSLDASASLPFKDVVAMLGQMNGNVLQFCERYPPQTRGGWLDQYMRVHQAIKHMIIVFDYETVKPRTHLSENKDDKAPTDIHDLVGLQLPAELHHYLYHGMIGPRVLDWLISGTIRLPAPLAGGDSDIYRRLVREQLDPWRKQALAMLAFTLSRYWQRKEFTTQSWYGGEVDARFNMGNLASEKRNISGWRVKEVDLQKQLKVVQSKSKHATLGSLHFALSSISDASFVSKTTAPAQRSSSETQLQSIEEITSNVLWRLLQLRGFINKEHKLTSWGNFLLQALNHIGNSADQAESIFLAVELMRLGVLDDASGFQRSLGGAPTYGYEADRAKSLLVSLIACTGPTDQQGRYSGPLNVNHLAYHSLVTEIKRTLRDLIDIILATMFLDDEVERIREDYLQIATALPFQRHWSVGLGIMSTFFLDESMAHREETQNSAEITERVKKRMKTTNVEKNLKTCNSLWDAFNAAVASAPADIVPAEQKKTWNTADSWFRARRGA